jgi:hypothetical protein
LVASGEGDPLSGACRSFLSGDRQVAAEMQCVIPRVDPAGRGAAVPVGRWSARPSVRCFTLLVIEKLKAAGFGYKREFLKEVIDHFVVGKRSVAVF